MNAKEQFFAAEAHVDQAAVQPFPNSRKIYVQGSRPDLRVPMREITLADTPTEFGGEKNPAITVYDCSGLYTDPSASIDLRKGLPALRAAWIEAVSYTHLDVYKRQVRRHRDRQPAIGRDEQDLPPPPQDQ